MSATIAATSAAYASNISSSSSVNALRPEERVLALAVFAQASQMSEAKTSVDLNAQQLEKLREQVKQALEQAREAQKESGFWNGLSKLLGSDLATIASAVAAVALVVASGGAAAAILAVVATAVSFASDHAKELGIPPGVAVGIAIGASIAALCVGDGKALFKVSDEVRDIAKAVKVGASVASATYKAEGAACGAVGASYERDAKYDHADAVYADGRQDVVSGDMDEALAKLSASLDRQNSVIEIASNTQQHSIASSFAVLGNWGGAA